MKAITSYLAVALSLSLGLTILQASGSPGVYALVDKVTFEPRSATPDTAERIRIEGVFLLSEGRGTYSQPKRGFIYFQIPPVDQHLVRPQWKDFLSVVGTRQVVGLNFYGTPVVHPANQKANVVFYPSGGNGLVKVNAEHPQARQLLEFKEH